MKCQKCEKPATFHITEMIGGKPEELHLCEEHAREYLSSANDDMMEPPANMAAALAQQMAQQMSIGQAARELEEVDQQTCPVCGISFYDFRSKGRLGCANDYKCFAEQLDQLILNVHGESEHTGKRPKGLDSEEVAQRTRLIQLRREMDEAVELEDYERASKIRDEIKRIEEGRTAE